MGLDDCAKLQEHRGASYWVARQLLCGYSPAEPSPQPGPRPVIGESLEAVQHHASLTGNTLLSGRLRQQGALEWQATLSSAVLSQNLMYGSTVSKMQQQHPTGQFQQGFKQSAPSSAMNFNTGNQMPRVDGFGTQVGQLGTAEQNFLQQQRNPDIDALTRQQLQQLQQRMNGTANPVFLPTNNTEVPSAAATAAMQAAQMRAAQQAAQARAAAAAGNYMPQGRPVLNGLNTQQSAQMALNANLQRGAAAGQIQFQNGKPMLNQGLPSHQQMNYQQQAAGINQANIAQKQAQQSQALAQLKAAIARNQAMKVPDGNNNGNDMYQQYNNQDESLRKFGMEFFGSRPVGAQQAGQSNYGVNTAGLNPQQLQQLNIAQAAGRMSPAIMQQAGRMPSPAIMQSANPGPAGIVNKEQRRLALACVALQLARGGVSVKQAINSGIMGGMSVTDVRFIVECYNAERLRMRNANCGFEDAHVHVRGLEAASAEDAINSLKLQQGHLECARGPSPALSVTRSDTSRRTSESMATAAAQATDMVNSLPQEVVDANFNALSYGFFGQANNIVGGALEDADASLGGLIETDVEVPSVASGKLEELDLPVGIDDELMAVVQKELAEQGNVVALSSDSINLTPNDGQTLDISAAEVAWLKAAASANQALMEGNTGEEEELGNDDLDARLANLDLGSGFF
eukprot:gene28972-32161_t